LNWGGGAFQARIAYGGAGSARQPASLGVLLAEPNAKIPRNVHHTEWEHIAVLSGRGTTDLGAERRAIKPGVLLHIPAGVPHDFSANDSEPLIAVQIFVPSGPEQRFVELASGK
jgi:mannose-6-phosphate isomerase-like protein (cupin superfamily)